MMKGWNEGFDVRRRPLASGAELRLIRRLARRVAEGSAATSSSITTPADSTTQHGCLLNGTSLLSGKVSPGMQKAGRGSFAAWSTCPTRGCRRDHFGLQAGSLRVAGGVA